MVPTEKKRRKKWMTHSPFWCWLTEILKKRVVYRLQVAFVLCFPPSSIFMQLRSISRWQKSVATAPPLLSANLNLLRILNLNKVDGSYHFINKLRHGIFFLCSPYRQLLYIHCLIIFSIQQQAQNQFGILFFSRNFRLNAFSCRCFMSFALKVRQVCIF